MSGLLNDIGNWFSGTSGTDQTLQKSGTWGNLQDQQANYVYNPDDPGAYARMQDAQGNYMSQTGGIGPNTGTTGMNADKWAGALKEISGGLKDASKSAQDGGRPQALPNTAQAHAAFGQGGTLGQLLQLLAARANAFNTAAHQGAVPTPTRPGGGLLGL